MVMNSTEQQLTLLNFPTNISRHLNSFSVIQLNNFVNRFISKLIIHQGLNNVQIAIDKDDNPYDTTINYITSVMEVGILHELYNQSFSTANHTMLQERLELLAWAVNISVATELKLNGIMRIPAIAGGRINIYYTWDNMEIIIQRIMPVASQIHSADPQQVDSYINDLINSKLR
jgi:hypothetical protein